MAVSTVSRVHNCNALTIYILRQRFQATEAVRNNVEEGYIEFYHDIWTLLYVTYNVIFAFDLAFKSVIRITGIHRTFKVVLTSLIEVLMILQSFES